MNLEEIDTGVRSWIDLIQERDFFNVILSFRVS